MGGGVAEACHIIQNGGHRGLCSKLEVIKTTVDLENVI